MNYLSINIRGVGGDLKSKWIRELVGRNQVSFLAMQETQSSGLNEMVVKRFWGKKAFEFEVVEPDGRSGGMISIWDPSVFKKRDCVKCKNFLMVRGSIKGYNEMVSIVNIYVPQGRKDKMKVWADLKVILNGFSGMWIYLGDFNAVRSCEERKGSKFKKQCANDFNEFIESSDLHEFPMKGFKFTFFKEDEKGKKFSKIDRVLVNRAFLDNWPDACFRSLPRLWSDHNPILLSVLDSNFGPKPFRVFNSWLDYPDCAEVVTKALDEFVFYGDPDVRLIRKFKWLRKILKEWRDNMVLKESEELDLCRKEMEEIDLDFEAEDRLEEKDWVRNECKRRIDEIETRKAKDLKQRSRNKWAEEGDGNNRFFHGLINNRRVSNAIQGLMIEDKWVDKPKHIKRHVHEFYKNKFSEDWIERPHLDCGIEKKLTDEEARGLINRFSKEEIKGAAFECGDDRAPGPDGISFKYIKRFWDYFEKDFFDLFDKVFEGRGLKRGVQCGFHHLDPQGQGSGASQ